MNSEAFGSKVPQPGGERITLVGNRTRALPLARALASVPGVQLRLRTPQTYQRTDPGTSDLLVLDGFMPKGGLPEAPGLLFVNPPRVPGGTVIGKMKDSRMSGFEAVQRLRESPETRAIPVIGLSAAALPRDTARAKEIGFDRYLTKPVKVDQLTAALEELLERPRQGRPG